MNDPKHISVVLTKLKKNLPARNNQIKKETSMKAYVIDIDKIWDDDFKIRKLKVDYIDSSNIWMFGDCIPRHSNNNSECYFKTYKEALHYVLHYIIDDAQQSVKRITENIGYLENSFDFLNKIKS